MTKLIVAAAMVVGFAAHATDHAATTKAPAAKTEATTAAPADAHHMAPTAATMTAEEAEKACKAEKAKDLKACVSGKVHKM